MTFVFPTIFFLAGSMLLLAILMAGRMRLMSLVGLFRLQAFVLALYAIFVAVDRADVQLLAIAALIVVMKIIVIPRMLLRAAHTTQNSDRLQSYARPTSLTFAAVLAALLSFAAARTILPYGDTYIVVATAFSLVAIGLLLLVSRKDMFGQGIGFLVMENGIFTLGLAITGGMPLLVEIGVLFDLMAFFVLIMLLVRRAQSEHSSAATDYLRTLID